MQKLSNLPAEELRRLQIKEEWIHEIVRRKILFEQDFFTKRCFAEPDAMKKELLGAVSAEGSGLSGLEYSRNALLGGRAGERRVVSDARGQPVSIDEVHPEVAGSPKPAVA